MSDAQIVTANRLRDGAVVYRMQSGGWSNAIAEAEVHRDAGTAADALALAEADALRAIVVAPLLIEIEAAAGAIRPVSLRERIRAEGPSVQPRTAI